MQPPQETSEFESPAWHGDILRETEQRYQAGLERPVDWATAKRELRARSAPDSTRRQIRKDMTTPKISIPDDQHAQESLQLVFIEAERSGVSQRTVSDVARQARQRCADEWKQGTHGTPKRANKA